MSEKLKLQKRTDRSIHLYTVATVHVLLIIVIQNLLVIQCIYQSLFSINFLSSLQQIY